MSMSEQWRARLDMHGNVILSFGLFHHQEVLCLPTPVSPCEGLMAGYSAPTKLEALQMLKKVEQCRHKAARNLLENTKNRLGMVERELEKL